MFYVKITIFCILGIYVVTPVSSGKLFKKQLRCILGRPQGKKIEKYGCICRKMNFLRDFTPIDRMDRCCLERYQCYARHKCDPKKREKYKMKLECKKEKLKERVSCGGNKTKECPFRQCLCDRRAALCLKRFQNKFKQRHYNMSKEVQMRRCKPVVTTVSLPPSPTTPTPATPETPTTRVAEPTTTLAKPAVSPEPKKDEYCGDVTDEFTRKYVINTLINDFSSNRDYPPKAFFGGGGSVKTLVGEVININVGLRLARFFPWHISFEVKGAASVSILLQTFDGSPVKMREPNPLELQIDDPKSFTAVTFPLPKGFRKKIVNIEILFSHSAEIRQLFVGMCFVPSNPIKFYEYFDDIPPIPGLDIRPPVEPVISDSPQPPPPPASTNEPVQTGSKPSTSLANNDSLSTETWPPPSPTFSNNPVQNSSEPATSLASDNTMSSTNKSVQTSSEPPTSVVSDNTMSSTNKSVQTSSEPPTSVASNNSISSQTLAPPSPSTNKSDQTSPESENVTASPESMETSSTAFSENPAKPCPEDGFTTDDTTPTASSELGGSLHFGGFGNWGIGFGNDFDPDDLTEGSLDDNRDGR